ncbi:MAG: tetratricopeptide repeat protein [Chloroflexi bacterium]|nr:tetratricopeptide repeat protein [Chloroflexota bacterium]
MSTPEPFPNWLKRRRKAFDLSREALARQVHCSVSAVRRLEAGDLRPSPQLAGLLAEALGLAADERENFVLFARGISQTPPPPDAYSPPVGMTSAAPEPAAGNLPTPLTSFVGRKPEVTAVCELLQEPGVRLLTLTGPPGTGKTRLSLAAAGQLAATGQQLAAAAVFPQGAFFVPLAPITDPDLVVAAIAEALGVAEPLRAGDGLAPLQQALKAYLRPCRLLLVLDNFEQVVGAAAVITDLLAAAPGVKALVTSREVLHVYGEHEFPVPPLSLPDVNRLPTNTAVSYLSRYPSVRLFQERARAARPDFRLTADNVADVARICAWLDGLPLAIEMAAAQVKWLTPAQVFAQLRTRLAALTGGPRDLTPRQQSLSGAIAWSYDLLAADERALFEVMGVFVGGADATAARAVMAALGLAQAADEARLTAVLQTLAAKSLLTYTPGAAGEPRFAMLETLREYAQEQLQARGLLTAVQQAHADYYAALAAAAQPHLVASADQVLWLALLEQEHHNLRAALAWVVALAGRTQAPAQVRAVLELVENLQQFWYVRGHLHQARHWLETALALSQEQNELHALILNRMGKFARVQGDISLAQTCHEQALVVQERVGDQPGLCRSLENLAILAGTQGDYGRARELLEQTLAIQRQSGETRPVVSTLNNLAIVLRRLGDLAGAERLYLEGTQLCRQSNNLSSLSYTLHGLGEVNVERGNPDVALGYFRESIQLRQQLGDRPELAISLGAIGMARMYLGDAAGAARLFAASERLRQELGINPAASYQAEAEAKIGHARALLGEAAFAQAWREGQALSLVAAVALAVSREL